MKIYFIWSYISYEKRLMFSFFSIVNQTCFGATYNVLAFGFLLFVELDCSIIVYVVMHTHNRRDYKSEKLLIPLQSSSWSIYTGKLVLTPVLQLTFCLHNKCINYYCTTQIILRRRWWAKLTVLFIDVSYEDNITSALLLSLINFCVTQGQLP
jgi:hypothetical protein